MFQFFQIKKINNSFLAIDKNGLLTNPIGTTMSVLPLPPMHAKTLMTSADFGCSKEIVEILAMMQIQNVFNPYDNRHSAEVTKRKFSAEEGDHLSLLNVYTCFVEVRILVFFKYLKFGVSEWKIFKMVSRPFS